jgi:undecaprenyl diphosphate synthase
LPVKLKDSDYKTIENLKQRGEIPKHIAVIMDGNGRWAKNRGLPRVSGHQRGIETVREAVEVCANLNVEHLTLYTFSKENWKRPKDEVSTLMRLIVKSLQNETDELHKNNIKLRAIGNIQSLPEIVQKELHQAMDKTKDNDRMALNLALSYSGRWDLVEAVKKIAELYKNDSVNKEAIDEELVSQNLVTSDIPDPDLMIRSGGELRVSNFLLWQIAYSEIYVTKVLWPDFNSETLFEAIRDFQNRERRFGQVSEQISKSHKNGKNGKNHSKHVAHI